ncbi:MAG: RNA recognition motif-containing protein [Oceanicoccus sp.]|jgi:RNA recognition motif-containing protein
MSKKLYIGNLSWGVATEDLRTAFEQYGEIEDAIVMTDRETGRSRGFGFVTFTNAEDAEAAVEAMHETELDGRPLTVNEARPKREF